MTPELLLKTLAVPGVVIGLTMLAAKLADLWKHYHPAPDQKAEIEYDAIEHLRGELKTLRDEYVDLKKRVRLLEQNEHRLLSAVLKYIRKVPDSNSFWQDEVGDLLRDR